MSYIWVVSALKLFHCKAYTARACVYQRLTNVQFKMSMIFGKIIRFHPANIQNSLIKTFALLTVEIYEIFLLKEFLSEK